MPQMLVRSCFGRCGETTYFRSTTRENSCQLGSINSPQMAAVAYTRAESTTCSLNILAEFALDSAEPVHVTDAPSKRKRPSRDTADTNTHNMSHQSIPLQGHRDEEHQTHRRVQHPGLVYDDLDPMMMASDPEVHPTRPQI